MFVQFVKFCMVGVSNMIVGLLVYYSFIFIRNDLPMAIAGQTFGWIFGVLNAFLWNRFYVFKGHIEKWYRALVKFYAGYVLGLLASLLLTYVQIQVFGVSTLLVPLINLAITTPLNFCILKFWVFKRSRG